VDPEDDAIAHVTFSGFRVGPPLAQVFRTTDHGVTWSNIGGTTRPCFSFTRCGCSKMRQPRRDSDRSRRVLVPATEEPMAMAEEPMADLVGRTLGEFILREQIGEGGCAVVYRCEQPVLQRDVVVKVLHARGRRNDAAKERFLREAQLASRLDHLYAAHVYAFGAEDDGLLWIAMELVQGTTLGAWLETHGPMPLEQLVPFFEGVAEVVQAAHDREIVHRDLKPSNVMVIERGGRLFPKLLDFGIAKVSNEVESSSVDAPAADGLATTPIRTRSGRAERTRTDPAARDDRLTRSSSKLGSAAYMSPEQWDNARAVGPATDIYSLGILVYEALTGRRPFRAKSTNEYYHQHLHAEIPPLGGDFSPDLDRVVRRALSKDPEARHGNVRELASALRATLRAQPREQLRSLAQVWADRDRAPALLLKSGDLMRAPTGVIGELERAFVAASRRHAARGARIRRFLAVSAAALVLAAVWYRGELKAELAEATVTQAELEQGRSALLHDEPEALLHLTRAYGRDRSSSTAFMLARAMQPRLAEQARFPSSSGRMWSATFSPDGKRLVTTDDKNAQVWDVQTHRLLFTLPHGDTVYQAVYSADGTKLVTAGSDGARIWDAAGGVLVRELRGDGTKRRYYALVMSSDDKLVAAIDAQGNMAHVWDTATGALIAEIRNDASDFPAIAFSRDGHWLATTGGNDVQVFDVQTRMHALTLHRPRIQSLAFDPTGSRLVTGAATGDVAIWEIPGGARTRHLRDVGEPVDAVAFSPDGQFVATATRDGTEQVWRPGSGELQSQFNPRHSKILAVEFDRASQLVLAAGADGTVVVADAALAIPVAELEGPQGVVWAAHFDPSSRRVVGASWDGTARVWNATSPYRRWSSPPVSDDCGIVTGSEPDRRFVAVGCRDHTTRVWDTARDQLLAELPSVSHVEGDFTSAFPAVSRAGDRAAIARGNTVEVYELPGGRLLRTIVHGAPVNAVAFASTGGDIVSGAIDGSLLVARDSGALLALPTSTGGVDAVGFLPDGRIAASDAQRRLRIYDPVGAVLADLEMPVRAMSLRIEGTRLVTVPIYTGQAAPPLLLDVERCRVIAQLDGHVGRVFSARWVAGDQIITAGGDGTARLWDGSTGRLRQIYRGSSRFLADATLASDDLVIGGGADGLLRFWDASSARLLWTLPTHKSLVIGVHVEGADIVTRGFAGELSRWTLPDPEQVLAACSDHGRCAIMQR
jgi:WD40 repeat protein/serine/threonine protein kinase